jgi:NAD+ diphosphatase
MPFAFIHNPLCNLPSRVVERASLLKSDLLICIDDHKIRICNNTLLLGIDDVNISEESLFLTLGQHKDQRVFILQAAPGQNVDTENDAWWSLRRIAAELTNELSSIAARACAINHWHLNHRYCARCGSPTQLGHEHSRRCLNDDCNSIRFPRIDPAIIVSVVNESEELLLGRQPHWDAGRYSVLAGFLGHGETLEDCVRREILEEAGVRVGQVEYVASQPWPFPGAIMTGFHAHAKNQTIQLSDEELEDALWISRNDLNNRVHQGTILLPDRYSISRYLIERWLN